MIEKIKQNIENIFRHIKNVQEDAQILAMRLLENGEIDTAKTLIGNALKHDSSKFTGIEYEAFILQTEGQLKKAIEVHRKCNTHHPEYWSGIKYMPDAYVAEMICDWHSRSYQSGGSIREWIDQKATNIYSFSKKDAIYEKIMYFLNLLLEKPMERID